jgi:hypothetical protein
MKKTLRFSLLAGMLIGTFSLIGQTTFAQVYASVSRLPQKNGDTAQPTR